MSKQVIGKTDTTPVLNFAEIQKGGSGPGPRGIKVSVVGVPGSEQSYDIDPNPHENPDYNNNGQKGFYLGIAEVIAKKCAGVKKKKSTFKPCGDDDRPPTIDSKKWLSMKLDAQKKARIKYNTEGAEEAEEKILKEYAEAIIKELGKFKGSYSLGKVTYSIG